MHSMLSYDTYIQVMTGTDLQLCQEAPWYYSELELCSHPHADGRSQQCGPFPSALG